MNTHRAVVESSVPPGMQLIAAGDRAHCERALVDWMKTHPLGQYQRPHLLVVDGAWLPTTEEELTKLVLVDPGVAALYQLAYIHAHGAICKDNREGV